MDKDDYLRMLAQLKRDEGAVRDRDGNHVVYTCPAGKRTIGYGHNLDANPVPGIGDKITEDQAVRLLEADVADVMDQLGRKLPWCERLCGPRYAVLVNMAFNMGVGGLLGFKNTLEFMRVKDYANAARNMRKSRWATQVGTRADRLIRQIETREWQ